MALDFNVSAIENWKEICQIPDLNRDGSPKTDTDGQPLYRWTAVTEAIIWRCLSTEMGTITKKNWKEWYARNLAVSTIISTPLTRASDGKIEHIELTPAEVRAHIGLRTNVGTKTAKQFQKKLGEWLLTEATRLAEYAIEKEEREK